MKYLVEYKGKLEVEADGVDMANNKGEDYLINIFKDWGNPPIVTKSTLIVNRTYSVKVKASRAKEMTLKIVAPSEKEAEEIALDMAPQYDDLDKLGTNYKTLEIVEQ